MGDYGAAAPWNPSSVKGCKRFLDRVAGLTDMLAEDLDLIQKEGMRAAVKSVIA